MLTLGAGWRLAPALSRFYACNDAPAPCGQVPPARVTRDSSCGHAGVPACSAAVHQGIGALQEGAVGFGIARKRGAD